MTDLDVPIEKALKASKSVDEATEILERGIKLDGGWSKNQATNDVHIPIKGK